MCLKCSFPSWLSPGTQPKKRADPQFWGITQWISTLMLTVVLHPVLYFLHNSCSFSCRLYGERHACYFSAKALLLSSPISQPTESFHKGHAGTCDINVCVNTCLYAYSWHFHIWQLFQQTEFLSYECLKENKCSQNDKLLVFGEKYLQLMKVFLLGSN